MGRSPRFGSVRRNLTPISDSLSLRLRLSGLTLLRRTTRRLIKQKAHRHTSPQPCDRGYSAPIACRYTVSGSISLPSPGFFSPFPHGTGSLSVGREYLAFEDGPPMFRQDCTCPALLFVAHGLVVSSTGLSPSLARLSRLFHYHSPDYHDWAGPLSLAT